ncbi:MAG: BREX-3 system P-loop-containing protein BrxF [Planctomycetes bacterium]|nr:BREX-3 system P-loop-containing protein BrxF [Planctomycetota bacterium]
MPRSIAEQVADRLAYVESLYHRLVLIVAPSASGKTAALQEIARQTKARLVNVNLEVSQRLLDYTGRQRALQVSHVLQEAVGAEASLVLLDNTEILFDVTLEQDPLRLLRGLSRNRTVVAAWNGTVERDHVVYAQPGHPEYGRYTAGDLMLVCPEAPT